MRCSETSLWCWCPSPSRRRSSGPLDAVSIPTASRATCVATAAATTLGCCATLRSDGSLACALGTVTRLPSANADDGATAGLPDDLGAAALRDPLSVGVRRGEAAGAVTRAEFVDVAAAGVDRGDRAGAVAVEADDAPAGGAVNVGRAGAGGPPACDSTRRAWCSRWSRGDVLPLDCCTT